MLPKQMWILATVLWHLNGVLPFCKPGTPMQCKNMPFVPGHTLIGQGFNAVRLESTEAYVFNMDSYSSANRSCQICRNPSTGTKQWQKLPLSIAKWNVISECGPARVFTRGTSSANEVAEDNDGMTQKIWHVGLQLGHLHGVQLRGPQSNVYDFASRFSQRSNIIFSTQRYTCSKYRLDISLKPEPLLSPEFEAALQRLSPTFDYSQYLPFIKTFGTHFIAQGKLGGTLKRIVAMNTCLAGLNDISIEDVNSCFRDKILINLGHSYSLSTKCDKIISNTDTVFGRSHKIMDIMDDRKGGSEYVEVTSDRGTFQEWSTSLKDSPKMVSYNLKPLHQLVSDRDVRRNLREAIITYMKQHDISRSSQPSCSNCCPTRTQMGRGDLRVYSIYATDLYGDIFSPSENYVTVDYGGSSGRTDTVTSYNPRWRNNFNFYNVAVGNYLVINVYDIDPDWEDHLGKCRFYITAGYNHVYCDLKHGKLYFTYAFTCHKHLKGSSCNDYNP